MLLLGGVAGCGASAEDTASESPEQVCAEAAQHYEQLRVVALREDPVLAREPGAAEEHARQTRRVAAEPVLSRCHNDGVGRCVRAASSFQQATACLGE